MNFSRFLKTQINKITSKVGIEIRRRPDPYQKSLYLQLYGSEVCAKRPFYNVGAGSFWHPYWTNIDFVTDWYKDMQKEVVHYDLMSSDPLPIKSDSAEIIYTSHTIEHIKEDAVRRFFGEAFRSLKPGGILRVTTGPDAETDFRAMQAGDVHWFYWDNMYVKPGTYEKIFHKPATSVPIEERWLHHVASALAPNDKSPSSIKFDAVEVKRIINDLGFEKALDYFTGLCAFDPQRPGNHVSWWTHKKIMDYLRDVGFTKIYRSGYEQSVSPVLRNVGLFDNTHPQTSIYVEAVK